MPSRPSLQELLSPMPTPPQSIRMSIRTLLNPSSSPIAPTSTSPHTDANIIHEDFTLTSRTTLKVVYEHAVNAIIEYPMSGRTDDEVIGHLFRRDPESWSNPANDFAYSRGPPRGYTTGKQVSLLVDVETGIMVPCTVRHSTCQGVKICPFYEYSEDEVRHSSASREQLQLRLKHDRELRSEFQSPASDVFERTSAFITALRRSGCSGTCLLEEQQSRAENFDLMYLRRGYPLRENQCNGRILFGYSFDGNAFIKCEHYSNQARDHLFDYTVGNGSYHLEYLEAVLTEDEEEVERIETEVEMKGYGPRTACHNVMNFSSQRPICPFSHRDTKGVLKQPRMKQVQCSCIFREYEPVAEFRTTCPYILVTSKGPHSHPIPLPEKTPHAVKVELYDLIKRLDIEMADITPRQFLGHPIVKSYLTSRFPLLHNPMLSDLHISLSNRSHLRVYIEAIKAQYFPSGTGWKGLEYLKHQQDSLLPADEHYVRQMIEIPADQFNEDSDDLLSDSGQGESLQIVICMTPQASQRFVMAQHLQSDIAFKRVVGFYEFEIASIDSISNTGITYCRVFLTRQTAAAHQRVLTEIDKILQLDTGRTLRWRHIHGQFVDDYDGHILNWVVDQHGGQAKGIGLYLQNITQLLPLKTDFHQPLRSIQSLGPYDHLQRFLTLCTTHFARNIRQCQVPEDVRNLMRSLVCVQHNDWDETIETIEELGGVSGKNWMNDKIRARFVFPAICWEKSYIPLDIWNARRRDSNITEILHADVNREGIHCSLVGGVKKSMHYDRMKLHALRSRESMGIRDSYKSKNLSENATKNLKRRSHNRFKRYGSEDDKITLHNKKIEVLLGKLQRTVGITKDKFRFAYPSGDLQAPASEEALRELEKAKDQEKKARIAFDKQDTIGHNLVNTGSGKVIVIIGS
ncbi:MAG: hypothetical protein NXY57DRAFT_967582 [Lentinula lateritia]|nr:MAG: hypothetical protein NXY57DRAFT_967582 [Lentinula lateritia]